MDKKVDLPSLTHNKEVTTPLSGEVVTSLHEYIRQQQTRHNPAALLLNQLHTGKGFGQPLPQDNNTLYYYNGHDFYHVFTRGGRIFLFIAKAALSLTDSRRKTIQNRFISLDPHEDEHMVHHFDRIIKLSNSKQIGDMTRKVVEGKFTLYMKDLQTPFIEISDGDPPLVVPLYFMTELAALNILTHSSLSYANQELLLATNEDFTIRVVFAGLPLRRELFNVPS